MSNTVPAGYTPLNSESVPQYLHGKLSSDLELGGEPNQWTVSEVGDGNLNLVFIVQGLAKTIVVKQALPYVRAAGESWQLSLTRAFFEYNVLNIEAEVAGHDLVPQVYFYDQEMAIFAMEYLADHIILRKELIAGKTFSGLGEDVGLFLAKTLFIRQIWAWMRQRKKHWCLNLPSTTNCAKSQKISSLQSLTTMQSAITGILQS